MRPLVVGIGGPVGSGKTALIDALCKRLRNSFELAVVTNDIFTNEDAEFLVRSEALPAVRVMAVQTGGCPHAAIREDTSINEEAIARMLDRFPSVDILFLESGGDNLAASFSPELVDVTIYIIDVAGGDKVPRKGGPGVTRSDLFVINKTDRPPMSELTWGSWNGTHKRSETGNPSSSPNLGAGAGSSQWPGGSSPCARVCPPQSPDMATGARVPAADGHLRLRLVDRRGSTTIVEQVVTAPFKLFRPQALPDGTLVLQVCVLGPGLRSGDQYRIELSLETGAKVVLLFPSATKVLGAVDGVSALQECSFEVAGGAQLEYYPGLTIPFPQAAFRQDIRAFSERGARFGILEMWAAGRVERGEELRFRELRSRTSVSVEGRPAYVDAVRMRPDLGRLDGPGILEGHRYWASGYWHWDRWLDQPDVSCDGLELVTGQPPHGSLYLRGLAWDGVGLRHRVHEILARQRMAWGLSPLDFGRYTNLFG